MNIRDWDFDDDRVAQFLAEQESQDIVRPDVFRDQVVEMFQIGEVLTGITLPWSKTHDKVRLREGEVSVWAGINGHLKSMLLGQVAMHAAQDVTVGIASFEMPVAATLRRMCQQASCSAKTSPDFAGRFIDWASQRMWFYNRLDTVPAARVLACVLYMGEALGCKLVVVDSLMMCGVSDDMERERKFMAQLTALAKSMKIHVALVHHVRKPAKGDDSYVPSRFDVKGNGAIVDLASTLFLCWNNKKKRDLQNRLDNGGTLSVAEQDQYDNEPDQLLIVAKQRNGSFEGKISLWIHPSMQFTARSDRAAIQMNIQLMAAK